MTRAPSSVKNAAAMLLPAPIPPVSPMIGATIAAVAIPTRTASRGSPRPHAIGARATLPPMKLASRRRRIALPGGGAVSAVVALPPGFRRPGRTPAVILAHGAGSNMTNPFLSSVHAGLLFLGYPLHPAGRSDELRADHLPGVALPMLFVQGTRDALCELERLRPVLARLPRATLHTIEGGDHSFRVPRRAGRTDADVW